MNSDEYEVILRAEFEGVDDTTFLLQLRINLTWDAAAFSKLITAMEACAIAHEEVSSLPRWIAEGFWYYGYFVQEWSSHSNFPREHAPEYYEAAYERLRDLAYWLFIGTSPLDRPFPPL